MNAAAYVRVSSKAQDLEMQRVAIQRAAEARGDVITEWFEEKASARTIDRAELSRVRNAARGGAIRKLYVFRLDRLARSGIRDTFEVVEGLQAHGCSIASVADGFSLDGPAAEIILAVMAWAAKMERLAINERIAAARVRFEGEGRGWGRPRGRLKRGADGAERNMDPGAPAKMLALRAAGKSVRDIAVAVKVPRSTVARYLASQKVAPNSEGAAPGKSGR